MVFGQQCHHGNTDATNIATNNSRVGYAAERKNTRFEITREEVNKNFDMRRCKLCRRDLLLCHTCPPTKHDSSNDARGWANPIKVSGGGDVAERGSKHMKNDWHRFFRGAKAIGVYSMGE
eukprot:731143-Hanusia_phi.AAC.1